MKTIKYLLMAIVIGTISGCSHYYVLTPSYTDIGKIAILSSGKTIEQTNQILATSPHEIAYISPKGDKVLVYNYATKLKKIDAGYSKNNLEKAKRTYGPAADTNAYYEYEQIKQVYVHFSDEKLVSAITTGELETGETLVFVNNRLEVLLNPELEKIASNYPLVVIKASRTITNTTNDIKTL